MVHYRKFRNTDPPGLVEVWNEVIAGHGAVHFSSSTSLERCVLGQTYFDPAGLIVAEENGTCLGFVHAGFAAGEGEASLSTQFGVICFLGVRPGRRRQGIGTQLLQHAEAYLCGRGAATLLVGPHRPRGPFYLGLYGGSDLPGILSSLPEIDLFLQRHGYQVNEEIAVLQRRVGDPVKFDARNAAHRQHFELGIDNRRSLGSWWQESLLGPLEPLEFFLVDKASGQRLAWALAWYMEGFGGPAHLPAAGLLDLQVKEDRRRQGLGKFLLAQVLRALQEQYFEIAEIQVDKANEAAMRLCLGLGFKQVDVGRVYKKEGV